MFTVDAKDKAVARKAQQRVSEWVRQRLREHCGGDGGEESTQRFNSRFNVMV
eukprot:CAMPEP_0173265734 /NCGR_PEP_ID=MMETSP1142-20121109/28758_1 /TAXON_ID=483371 /ORGANISM="non described non described, Strain CCMP2298" /LENGTH=51 /DNA_ID=CAMNT_0014201543 /DNA_START=16 /DNA_END=168 /DNA_ORIENTATION=+